MRTAIKIIFLLCCSTSIFSQKVIESYTPAMNYGDKSELKRYFEQEIYIPQKYLDEKIHDEVILCFVVTENGEIRELQVSKSINPEIDKISLQLFDRILWTPAYYNGKPVNTKECLAIKYSHKKYKKYIKKRGYKLPPYTYSPIDSSNTIYKLTQLDTAPKPMFEGEFVNIGEFIKNEIRYPEMAYANNITGTVKISFIVEQSGRISNIKVGNYLGGGCDAEAMRLLTLLTWKPGYKDKHAVRTSLTFTINFNLMEGADLNYVPSSTLGGTF